MTARQIKLRLQYHLLLVKGWDKSLAFVQTNIRVTCIEPGVVYTELLNTITDEGLKGFLESAKNMQGLQADDIANAILFAVQSPEHMNVNEILVRPTTQEH